MRNLTSIECSQVGGGEETVYETKTTMGLFAGAVFGGVLGAILAPSNAPAYIGLGILGATLGFYFMPIAV